MWFQEGVLGERQQLYSKGDSGDLNVRSTLSDISETWLSFPEVYR
jgi:hypothetical protein